MGSSDKDFEKVILRLLDESPAIQKKIRNICFVISQSKDNMERFDLSENKRLSDLENQVKKFEFQTKNLKNQLDFKANEYDSLLEMFRSLEMQKSRLENELKTEKTNYQSTIVNYENEIKHHKEKQQGLTDSLEKANSYIAVMNRNFSDPVKLLERYRSLSVSTRTGLSDVICGKNVILFIASCSTAEHLKSLWIFTKRLYSSQGDPNEIKILTDIFDYFFDIFNNSLSEPMYVRDNVENGCFFNDDRYDRCIGSSTSGRITQVIIRGYSSINTGEPICRSLVRV